MKKILVLIMAGLTSLSAQALTATGTFNVTINFTSVCSVNTAGLQTAAFLYTSNQTAPAAFTTAQSFSVTCTNGVPYTMALDAGGTGYTAIVAAPTWTYTNTASGLIYSLTLPAATAGTGTAQTYALTGSMAGGQAGTCTSLGGGCPFVDAHTLTITY